MLGGVESQQEQRRKLCTDPDCAVGFLHSQHLPSTSDLAACPIGMPFDVCLTKIFLNSFLNPRLKRDRRNFWSYSSIKALNHLKPIEGRLKAALGAVKLLLAFETAKHTDYIGSEHLSVLLNR